MLSAILAIQIAAYLSLGKETTAFTQTAIPVERSTLTSHSRSRLFAEFIPSLPSNPFGNVLKGLVSKTDSRSPDDELPLEFEPTPRGLIFQAKRLVASDFGLLDPSLLDDTQFRWIDANSNSAVALTKTEYVAAGRFFNLRGAFPDIDYRAHDYRVVEVEDSEADAVRLTCRVQGTMRGELRLRDGIVAPPTGLRMKCPPEAISITFDLETGKVTKLCSGFGLDRLVGNTAGTTGVVAASIIAGQPAITDWDLYPPTTILQRVFARPAKRIDDAEVFLAPFPEQVMIQLARGILSSNLGFDDPSLLSDKEFTFMTPTVGPIRKKEFLAKYAYEEFANIEDPQFSNFRVDPYDPVRVWVDLQPKSPGFEGHPQAMSLAFDDDGYCTRITSWAVMDPSIGNGGGLGGPEGYKYATGSASLSLTSRPLPSILERFKKTVLSPITGISVDEYSPASGAKPVNKIPRAPIVPPAIVAQQAVADDDAKAAAVAVMKRLETLTGEISKSIRIQPPTIPSISIRPPNAITKSVEEKEKERLAKTEALKRQQAIRQEQDRKEKMEKEQKAKQLAAAAEEAARNRQIAARNAAEDAKRRAQKQQQKPDIASAAAAAKAAAARRKEEAAAAAAAAKEEAARRKEEAAAALAAAKEEAVRRKEEAAAAAAAAKEEAVRRKEEAAKEAARNKKRLEEQKAAQAAVAEEARRKQQIASQKAAAAADEERRKKVMEAQRAADAKRAKEEAEKRKIEAEKLKQEQMKEREIKAKERLAAVKVKVADPTQQRRERAALDQLSKLTSGATFALFGLGGRRSDDDDDAVALPAPTAKKVTKTAPPGVPTLSRWRRNSDNSITGLVRGSSGFTDGQRVTTSPIQSGTVAPGEVVKTGSGSRYFLE